MDLMHELAPLLPLLSAEAAAEAPGAGVEPADLEQAVWVRLLERDRAAGRPSEAASWLRRAVRAEARTARRRALREIPYGGLPEGGTPTPERAALEGEAQDALRSAVARLPGRCPELLAALLSPRDLTYREIAGELGISQGSLGPVRSRCLGCLRRMLTAEVAAPELRGKER
ncbi:sigma-70 family RNA polymerase sigma factor [Streptomyces bambusae]|uniref:RNA polymerase sigma factor n=1 Tax=Streptomyces bambusae TaxID=1550616 RepID=UPI001CFDA413|nr:sigma-70 family RNA polymerase sigma factor [Streptomyces bambusae]MCB5168993.1 sigma-70 family RNA polymerase sigma factor [Streptomyces bambusae]